VLENPLRLLGRLPRPVRLLVLGTFVNKLGTFIIPYLAIVLRREFHLKETEVGALMMVYGLGSIVSILIGGHFADKFGRRSTLLLSLFGSGALAIALGFFPSIRTFIPLLLLLGFVADLYRPAASAIISDLLSSDQRALGFAALRMAVNLGFTLGVVTGGLIADWDWRVLFFGDGLTTLLYGVIVLAFIGETRPEEAPSGPRAESPFLDRVYLQVVFVGFVFCLVLFNHVTVLPLTITVSAGYPARAYGLLVGVNGLLIALFEVSIVARLRGFKRLRVAALGVTLAGVGFALTGLVLHWAWFLVTVLFWTAGEILTVPQQMAFIADWAPPASRGRYMSVFQASWSLSFALNPILFFPLHARLGEALFWPLMLVVMAPGILLLLRLDRVADRPERLRGRTLLPGPEIYLTPEA
jgi:MFS family permease